MQIQLRKIIWRVSTVILMTIILNALSHAQDDRRKGPPREAKEACANKSEGDAITFESRRDGPIDASCQLIEDELVAVPENHRQNRDLKEQRDN
ncbi:hypothetical protein [Alteromonas sp. KUL106]|uniref:hypothetical protein n=1 Tax=Alteromonas sp. KUL106 TaxID=2480799 RepID=UPI0012E55689|nr:hypothetical protein [Alteromonas sp. KUL106]GFD67121.1 hypothetical protein KUL106_03840 [Alteromonas sp. KUL106]